MIPFQPDRSAFGRHETFPLRFGWLTKGFAAWGANPGVFESDDATVELGVGKNMVSAIRYWMTAAQVLAATKRGVAATEIGDRIFGAKGWDPYLEDDATIWLVHWLIASNASEATAIFWFFNRFHKPEFTSSELQAALADFVARDVRGTRAAASTIRHDVNLLLRMYEPTGGSKIVPVEELLDSPLSMLSLVRHPEGSRFHESRPERRPDLPLVAFAFSVAELFQYLKLAALPVDLLLHSDGLVASPGSVFRLNEEGLIAKIEELVSWMPKVFALRETAGIRQLFQQTPKRPLEVLRMYYERRDPRGDL